MAMKDKVPAVIQEVKGHNSRPRAALLLRAFPVIISPLSSFFLTTKSSIKVPSTFSLFTQLHFYSYSRQCTFVRKENINTVHTQTFNFLTPDRAATCWILSFFFWSRKTQDPQITPNIWYHMTILFSSCRMWKLSCIFLIYIPIWTFIVFHSCRRIWSDLKLQFFHVFLCLFFIFKIFLVFTQLYSYFLHNSSGIMFLFCFFCF